VIQVARIVPINRIVPTSRIDRSVLTILVSTSKSRTSRIRGRIAPTSRTDRISPIVPMGLTALQALAIQVARIDRISQIAPTNRIVPISRNVPTIPASMCKSRTSRTRGQIVPISRSARINQKVRHSRSVRNSRRVLGIQVAQAVRNSRNVLTVRNSPKTRAFKSRSRTSRIVAL